MNQWDKRFQEELYVYGTEPNEFIREFAHVFKERSTIAAYAEGEGRNAVYLAMAGHDVVAYDYAASGLDKTKRLAELNDVAVDTVLTDLLTATLPTEEYDGAILVFGHFARADQYEVLSKMIQSVKKDGVFLLEVYGERQLQYNTGGPKSIDWLYDGQELKQWAQQYEMIHFYEGEQERIEGTLHTGKGYVIQLAIRKK